MSKLLAIRQKLHLTQEELVEKSGISARTIQRIEAGSPPKGHTLKALANALGIAEADLLEDTKTASQVNTKWLKIINLSTLLFVLLPPLNIAIPLFLMYRKKLFTPVYRQLITIQVLMTLIGIVLLLLIVVLKDWFSISSKFTLLMPMAWVLVNCLIILINAAEIDKRQALRIYMNFSVI